MTGTLQPGTTGYVSRGELQRQRYLRTGCPKPASRKDLKRVMPDAGHLTTRELFERTGRRPGWGRTARWLKNIEDAQKEKAELRELAKGKEKKAEVKSEAKSPGVGKRIVGAVSRMFNRRGSRGA